MLSLRFRIGGNRCAMDVARIVEVLPLVDVRPLPNAAPGLDGAFNYRGTPVPVVDLSRVTLGRPSARRMSTRIIVVRHSGPTGASTLVGLVAEQVQAALSRDVPAAREATLTAGAITTDAEGLLHWIDVNGVLEAAALPIGAVGE